MHDRHRLKTVKTKPKVDRSKERGTKLEVCCAMLRRPDSSVKQKPRRFLCSAETVWNQQGSRYESLGRYFIDFFPPISVTRQRIGFKGITSSERQPECSSLPVGRQSGLALPRGARLVRKQLPWPTFSAPCEACLQIWWYGEMGSLVDISLQRLHTKRSCIRLMHCKHKHQDRMDQGSSNLWFWNSLATLWCFGTFNCCYSIVVLSW